MNILIISEYFPSGKDLKFSGGVEARNLYIAKYLGKKHKLTIITSKLSGQKNKETIYGAHVVRVGKTRKYNATVGDLPDRAKFLLEAIRAAGEINADVVEGTNFITHFIAKRISGKKKIPSLAWYPDVWLTSWVTNAGLFGIFGEILERVNLLFGFDAYIAISEQTAGKLRKYVKGKINVVYCGTESQNNIEKHRGKLTTIICVSRLAPYKNLKTLILAFAQISTNFDDLQLNIVGSGPLQGELKNLSRQLHVSKRVKFYSNLKKSELFNLYKTARVFCLPSLVEGFGIATIEAASFGVPYVVSDIPIFREITKAGKGGYLADPTSPINFSKKLSLLMNDDIYAKKSLEAKKLSKLYSWKVISRQTENVYKSLL